MKNEIGNRIRQRREELHISQKTIQEETNISTGNLSGIENGRNYPSAMALIGLSKSLRCTTDWILKGEKSSSQAPDIILNNTEVEMLLEFRKLSENDKADVLGLLHIKSDRIGNPE